MVVTTKRVITGLVTQPTVRFDKVKTKMSFVIVVTANVILEVTPPVRLEKEP